MDYQRDMIDKVEDAIRRAFLKLIEKDGSLFECPIEEHAEYDSRKLHEVCINHKLAQYLEEFIFPIINQNQEKYFTDIEFNREGIDFKNITIEGQQERVRPDIIIHNRKSGNEKLNFLIVECKKYTTSEEDKQYDRVKIKAFLTDPNYKYNYGLQVIYSQNGVTGTLFYFDGAEISSRQIII